MLIAVAVLNAADVCPEGNDGLPPFVNLIMSGYVVNGRSLLNPNFIGNEINVLTAKAPIIIIEFCLRRLSF